MAETQADEDQADFTSEISSLPEEYDYLAPDGSEIRLLPELSGGGMAHCTLPPGCVTIALRHQTVEEIWYGLSGEGEIWRHYAGAEDVVRLQPHISIIIPVGTHFQFRNTGDKPFCFLIVTMPPWPGADEAEPVPGKWQSTAAM